VVPDLRGIIEDAGFGRVAGRLLNDGLQALLLKRRSGDQFVGVVNVGAVVLSIMKFDGVGADDWRQGVFCVGQIR
jgi:hypothetical protein